jgi:tetratricopeptide (TPR) repeat protein
MHDAVDRPYPGPRAFVLADRGRFFGRAEEISMLAQWWMDNRLTYLTGPAGRGKTSLLEAGLLPLLSSSKTTVLPTGRLHEGAAFPVAMLPAHNPYSLALLRSWSPGEATTRLAGLSVIDFARRMAVSGTVLAAIDPVDELAFVTGPRRFHQQRFLTELRDALDAEPRLHLLIVGRHEGTAVVADVLGNGLEYELNPLTWPSALEAMTGPLTATAPSFGDGAADSLLVDLQTSRVTVEGGRERRVSDERAEAVLLQVACASLWEALPVGTGQITDREARAYGDVDNALAEYCGRILAEVAGDHDLTFKQLRAWLLATFVTDLGTRKIANEERAQTAGMRNEVARALEDRHLLTARRENGSRRYELLSDRLIEPLRQAPAARLAPIGPEDQLLSAERALSAGALDRAERYALKALRQAPLAELRLRANTQSLLGNIAFERDKPIDAESRFREAAQLFAAAEDIRSAACQLAAVGQTLLVQGRAAEAVGELHAAVTRLPSDPVLVTELAESLWQDDKGTVAVAILNDVLRIDGGNRSALRARGEILAFLGEARQAMLDLDRISSMGSPQVKAARGLALAGLGDQRGARREIEDALAEGPHNGQVLLAAARVFYSGGDEVAARDFAQQAAVATDPPLSPSRRETARHLTDHPSGLPQHR